MNRHLTWGTFVLAQLGVLAAFGWAFSQLSETAEQKFVESVAPFVKHYPRVEIERETPLTVEPFYDDAEVVTDRELAAVLKKIRPIFPMENRKPNYVEHALRAWSERAEFRNLQAMSGVEMRDFLVDHGKWAASWGDEAHNSEPMLLEQPRGIGIRWGSESKLSVHHDHLLACLTEAGVNRNTSVYPPSGREMTIDDVIQESLRDFRLDERETEWSALAYSLWLPPQKSFRTAAGRNITFDMLARRLIIGQRELGVCSGTHRVYSLMLLWRINQEHEILTEEVAAEVWAHLEGVRDSIIESQMPDGRWPTNWPDGRAAVETPRTGEPEYRDVIATGHHLEWLAIAPEELHPPRENIRKAADWIIANTTGQTDAQIMEKYTFYSHVGNALALWRKTHPAEFWKTWTAAHPDVEADFPDKKPPVPIPVPN